MNKKNGFFELLLKNGLLFSSLLIALCGIGVLFYNVIVGAVLILLAGAVFAYSFFEENKNLNTRLKYYSSMSEVNERFDITKGISAAMVSVGIDGRINWWNDAFTKICPDVNMHDGITEHIPRITVDALSKMGKDEEMRVEYKDACYLVSNVPFKAKNATDSAFVITLSDITALEKYKKEAQDSRVVIAHVLIDNIDELLTEEGDDVSYQAEKNIEKMIFEWAKSLGGSARHLEKGRYMCLLNSQMLDLIKDSKFDVLEKVKSLGEGSAIEPTLSIGVGIEGIDINETDAFAKAALDMALGRGGDQAVVKDLGNFFYYGGKARETEKRTKVKSRVKALALLNLIKESSNVIVMGHINADADSLGASVAIACVASAHGKQAKVVLETYDSTVKALLDNFAKSYAYNGLFVNKAQAREILEEKTLVVVCDTHRKSLAAAYDIVEDATTVVLIDHHRRSEDFIANTDLIYHEPFASSSCEMITEMLQYMGRGGISAPVAEAMYAGILIDTNNFIYKTGVRTFEAAAYLKRLGADTVNVKKMCRETRDTLETKNRIVEGAEVYKNQVAISRVETGFVKADTMAKAANEIMEIEGMKASFVIANVNETTVAISGRSFGDVNIQLVLEKLGGGGHLLAGAVQLEDATGEEAEARLIEALEEYDKEK